MEMETNDMYDLMDPAFYLLFLFVFPIKKKTSSVICKS